jgi:DNA-binding NtrC family response regulator
MEWEPFEWELPAEALTRAAVAAQLEVPVLLIGETGTGHVGVAQYIHAHSRRATGPFIPVNMGMLPDSLLLGDLVGRASRTTDAPLTRTGLIGLAAGGILFAYTIDPISPGVDSVLRRLLQEGIYQPIGGAQPHKADVRVVAATHDDLQAAASRGEIGQDLCNELRGFEIYLSPLRERREEILGLAKRHVAFWCDAIGRERMDLGSSAEEVLRAHSWPGNLRELTIVISRTVMTSNKQTIEEEDLPIPRGSSTRP